MRKVRQLWVGLVLVFLVGVCPVTATEINLGSGWYATLPGGVSVSDISYTQDYLKLSIVKDVTQPPNEFGEFDETIIAFRRTAAAPQKLIIEQETVMNHTGKPWTDFHMVLGTYALGFDNSTGTPSGTPFSRVAFSDYHGYGTDNLPVQIDFDIGTVLDGGTFSPAAGATQIVIMSPARAMTFPFKEQPTPEPVTVLSLAAGAWGILRRRR
jgi:hypothetical protein